MIHIIRDYASCSCVTDVNNQGRKLGYEKETKPV